MTKDLRTFLIIWGGQFVSLIGTGMTRFAVLIWAYQQTGTATSLALLGFFAFLPFAIVSPLAGVVVDRFDRRKVMLYADGAVGVVTIGLLLLFARGELAIWHLFVAEFLIGSFEAFQAPAYAAAMTMLIPKDQLGRMNGLQTLALNASRVVAPFIGGALLPFINLDGIMLIDVATFCVAMLTLMIVRVPMPPQSEGDSAESTQSSFIFGLRFIWQRPGLRGLTIVFSLISLLASITYFGVMPAMILARSGGNELALATVQALLGVGGVIGAVIMTAWGGSKRKIDTIMICMILSFLLGDVVLGFGRNLLVWSIGAFTAQIFLPPLMGSFNALWQSKIPLDQQGRVIAAREAVTTLFFALGFLLAGPLADQLFEPAMAVGGAWANQFGWLVGTGKGAGMGLMFIGTGTVGALITFIAYLLPSIRHVEADLPDYDAVVSAETS